MALWIFVNIGLGNGLLPDGTWVDYPNQMWTLSMGFRDIHLKALPQRMLWISDIEFEIHD